MKNLLLSSTFTCLALSASAESLKAKVSIPVKDGKPIITDVTIEELNDKDITFIDTTSTKRKYALEDTLSVFIYRPEIYTDALEAYHDGDLKAAQKMFSKCKTDFQLFKNTENSYPLLASFYEMECARRLGDYKTLDNLQKLFIPKNLKIESHRSQVEVYTAWEAYNGKDWSRLLAMMPEWEKKNITATQRAQLEYCFGAALMETGEINRARVAFSSSLALNQFKEPELFILAAKRGIDSILADKRVDTIKSKVLGGEEITDPTRTYYKLLEAVSIARMWDEHVDSLPEKLDPKYEDLLKIKNPDEVGVEEEKDEENKGANAKESKEKSIKEKIKATKAKANEKAKTANAQRAKTANEKAKAANVRKSKAANEKKAQEKNK